MIRYKHNVKLSDSEKEAMRNRNEEKQKARDELSRKRKLQSKRGTAHTVMSEYNFVKKANSISLEPN